MMATKRKLRFDHPTYITRHFAPIKTGEKFYAFADMRIKSFRAIITSEATAEDSGWEVMSGTMSLGKIAAGTSTEREIVYFDKDISLAAGNSIELQGSGVEGQVFVEYDILPSAEITV
jgi:hypothetical protein